MNSATYDGMKLTKHTFTVPVDYSNPTVRSITVFAREVVAVGCDCECLPYLVYFQGGPGFSSERPLVQSGWLRRALKEYRVLLIDSRGTGLSSPIDWQSLKHLNPVEQAEFLCHFRADNIVRDAEYIRERLNPGMPWDILGHSFGGFCVLRYLSASPEGLREAYITGGVPSLSRSAEDVYRATYQRVLSRNCDFFLRFPDAERMIENVVEIIDNSDTLLSDGSSLTVEMLQLLGINLGMEKKSEAIYYLLEQAVVETKSGAVLSPLFLEKFPQMLSFNTHPIYALLHESIYCQESASGWAAHRVREQYPQFNCRQGSTFLFTGEMVYPWMFDQIVNLKPLKECAELLARKEDWPLLYNLKQLADNKIPVAAVIYSEDMFVEREYSLETIGQVGNIRYWLTSEFEHNGLSLHGEVIFDKLISLNRRGGGSFR